MTTPEIQARKLLNFPPEGELPQEMSRLVIITAQALLDARASGIQETVRILEAATPAEWLGMAETLRGAREVLVGCTRRAQALLK